MNQPFSSCPSKVDKSPNCSSVTGKWGLYVRKPSSAVSLKELTSQLHTRSGSVQLPESELQKIKNEKAVSVINYYVFMHEKQALRISLILSTDSACSGFCLQVFRHAGPTQRCRLLNCLEREINFLRVRRCIVVSRISTLLVTNPLLYRLSCHHSRIH